MTDSTSGFGVRRSPTEAAPDTGAAFGPHDTGVELPHEMDVDHTSSSVVGPFLMGGALLVFGLLALRQTFAINGEGFDLGGSRFFPLIVTCMWLALSVIYLVQHARAVLRNRPAQAAETFRHRLAIVVMVVLLVAYAYAIDPLGYVISTALFFVAAARTTGSTHLLRDVVAGLGLSLGVYLLFTHILGVILPAGVLSL